MSALSLVRKAFLFGSICASCWIPTIPAAGDQPQPASQRPPIPHYQNSIQAHWISNDQFWYSFTPSKGSTEFTAVDAKSKMRFRAGSLKELMEKSGLQLSTSQSQTIPPSSSDGNQPAKIVFVNGNNFDVRLFWLDASGRSRLYHTLAPQGRIEQNTYTGHTWFAVDPSNKPVWFASIAETVAELKIETQEIKEPYPRFPGSRRSAPSNRSQANLSPDGKWKSSRVENDLRLQTADEIAADEFTTKNFSAIAGSTDCSYTGETYWSPNSQYALAIQIEAGDHRELTLVESSPKKQLQPIVSKTRYDKPGDKLDKTLPRLLDVNTKRHIPIDDALFSNPWSLEEFRWASDSSSFTFLYNQRGHQCLRLIRVDAATGQASVLFEERSPTYVDYAHKAFRRYLDDSNEIIWGSERDGWYHLYLIDAMTGKIKNQITRGEWVVRDIESIDTERRQIWFYAGGISSSQDPYYRHLCRVNFDGTNLVQLTQGDGDHSCEFSPTREYFIDKYSRIDLPPVFELRNSASGELVLELEASSAASLVASGWQAPERFVAKGRDGTTDIYGIIIRPFPFDPSLKYPIVEAIYAGPQDSFVPKSFSPQTELTELADKGFIVVKMDGMGTSNRSKAFHDVSYKNLSDGGFPDRKLWITAAAKKYPQMDTSRIGIFGGSAGGQNALAALLFFGDFYHAAVADCGCHDNRMDKVWWNELYMGWPIGPHYESNSNVTNAHRLTGKLYLMVGELDNNVDPSSTMQVVNALIKADKNFDLLVTPSGGHGSGSSPYGKRRRDEFFLQHLGSPKP